MYSTLTISNFFIFKSWEETGVSITPLKLIKIVYYAHGWYLALTGKPLINENIIIGDYGPIIDSIYVEYKNSRNKRIKKTNVYFESYNRINDENIIFLNKIFDIYSKYTDLQLATLAHKKDTPWFQEKINKGSELSNDLIKDFFLKKSNENELNF